MSENSSVGEREGTGTIVGASELAEPRLLGAAVSVDNLVSAVMVGAMDVTKFMEPSVVEISELERVGDRVSSEEVETVGAIVSTESSSAGAGESPGAGTSVPPKIPGDMVKVTSVPSIVVTLVGGAVFILSDVGELVSVGEGEAVGVGKRVTVKLVGAGDVARVGDGVGALVGKFVGEGVGMTVGNKEGTELGCCVGEEDGDCD